MKCKIQSFQSVLINALESPLNSHYYEHDLFAVHLISSLTCNLSGKLQKWAKQNRTKRNGILWIKNLNQVFFFFFNNTHANDISSLLWIRSFTHSLFTTFHNRFFSFHLHDFSLFCYNSYIYLFWFLIMFFNELHFFVSIYFAVCKSLSQIFNEYI